MLLKKTKSKKKSFAHKTGLLYKDRILNFKKKRLITNLYIKKIILLYFQDN